MFRNFFLNVSTELAQRMAESSQGVIYRSRIESLSPMKSSKVDSVLEEKNDPSSTICIKRHLDSLHD